MDPATATIAAGGIMAGSSLLQGIFQAAAEKKKRTMEMLQSGVKMGAESSLSGYNTLGSGSQAGFGQLIEGMRSALVR